MTILTIHRSLATLLGLALLLLALVGCSSEYRAPGDLGTNQQILDSCPKDLKLNTFVQSDGTGSNRDADITEERLLAIEKLARSTAVCGGHLTVTAYSAGSASTITIYDAEITLPGATDNARLRKVPETVEAITAEIRERYDAALDSLPPGGSDITSMWRLAAEQQAMLGDGYQLRYVLFTDGLDTISGVPTTSAESQSVADTLVMPDFTGANVTIAGVGRVTGPPTPSNQVEALVAFYEQLCKNTNAAQCLVVTDWR